MKFYKRPSRLFVVQAQQALGRLSDREEINQFVDAGSQVTSDRDSTVAHIGSIVRVRRLHIATFVLFCLFFLFVARSAQLQIVQGAHFRTLAESNRFHSSRILSERGLILDTDGIVLAENIPSFTLTMTIADLPSDPDKRTEGFKRISELSGLQPTELDLLLTQYAQTPFEPVPVKRHIPFERAMHLEIETKQLPGFELVTGSIRQYPFGHSSLSHLLGYTGKTTVEELNELRSQGYRAIDSIGKTGVEKSAEQRLRGRPGEIVTEVNARGKELTVVSKTDPIQGENIHLTIHASFQKFIEDQLQVFFLTSDASRASVVALDPQTGDVYASVSLPTFDNNLFARGIDTPTYQALLDDTDHPLFPRAIAGEFPSGSTFKPFVAYAALTERLISEHTSFLSTGGLRINEWFFPDWKVGGHGVTDVGKAIADSVNTFFYIIGGGFDQFTGLGVKRIRDYAEKFGFGTATGIDLPGEKDGFLPSKEWKEETKGERWYVGDTYHFAIGQGDFLTTPMQMAHATGILANDGISLKPHVIKTSELSASEQIEGLDTAAMTVVKNAMRRTVVNGSARSLSTLPVAVAGKTGTAQASGSKKFHSWFTGFAPFEDPRIVLVVLVEEGGESTDAAVPLARKIFEYWMKAEHK